MTKLYKKTILTLMSLLSLSVLAQSGDLDKRIGQNRLKDRVFQSDYFYFITGSPNTKLNFSVNYLVSKKYQLELKYNQTMFWELSVDSKPFSDINFNPQLLKSFQLGDVLLDIGIYEHHSNGKSGDISRSYDSFFLSPKFEVVKGRFSLFVGLKAALFYRVEERTKEIEKYNGHFILSLASKVQLGGNQKRTLGVNYSVSPGGEYDNLFRFGFHKIDIIFNPGLLNLPFNIHGQIYTGYGERLIDYDKRSSSYRIGISI